MRRVRLGEGQSEVFNELRNGFGAAPDSPSCAAEFRDILLNVGDTRLIAKARPLPLRMRSLDRFRRACERSGRREDRKCGHFRQCRHISLSSGTCIADSSRRPFLPFIDSCIRAFLIKKIVLFRRKAGIQTGGHETMSCARPSPGSLVSCLLFPHLGRVIPILESGLARRAI